LNKYKTNDISEALQLEHKMKQFVRYYNNERYHESINNLTPSEVYYGTGERKLRYRKRIKQQTLIERKKQNQNIYLN
jgi:putative transposase